MTDDLSPAVRLMYDEISNSFHKVDDFRAKLLGFLPLASGTLMSRWDSIFTSCAAYSGAIFSFVWVRPSRTTWGFAARSRARARLLRSST